MAGVSGISVRNRKIQVGFKGLVTTTDESILSHEYAKECHNFVIENGVLNGDIGIDKAQGYFKEPNRARHEYPDFPENTVLKKVFLYRRTADGECDDRLIAHTQDGLFWYTSVFSVDTWHKIEHLRMLGEVEVVNYNYNSDDVILLSSDVDGLFLINDTAAYACSTAPKFTSITVHNERVFGGVNGEKTQVWFSDDFNPANWSVSSQEAGFIDFADGMGNVLKVVSFLNYLYIFREFGIFRLTAYGAQSDFILKKVFTDTGRIYKDTIVTCGNKIMMYAEGGIFVFDGYEVVKVANEMPPVLNKTVLCAAYLDDCYYLACRIAPDDFLNNAVIKYDTRKKTISILYDCMIRWLSTINIHNGADVLCVFDTTNRNIIGMMSKSGKVLNSVTTKTYKSPMNDLSLNNYKVIRDISFVSKYPITVRVDLDGKKTEYKVDGKQERQTVIVERSGKAFGLEIESNQASVYVSPITVNMDIIAD